MTSRVLKILFLVVIAGFTLAGFEYITPDGHLPEQITGAVEYVKSTLDWVSYSIIDLGALLTCLGIIIGLESALIFLRITMWVIQYIG